MCVEWIRSSFFKLESIPQILRYCIYETICLAKIKTGSQGIDARRRDLRNRQAFKFKSCPIIPLTTNLNYQNSMGNCIRIHITFPVLIKMWEGRKSSSSPSRRETQGGRWDGYSERSFASNFFTKPKFNALVNILRRQRLSSANVRFELTARRYPPRVSFSFEWSCCATFMVCSQRIELRIVSPDAIVSCQLLPNFFLKTINHCRTVSNKHSTFGV